jgi:hypothetical protein
MKQAIIQVLAKKENLIFSDLRFILLEEGKNRKVVGKNKRRHYNELKEIFSKELFFQKYSCTDANLAGTLNRMINNFEIKKTKHKKYKLLKIQELEAIRLRDITNIKSYPLNQIYVYAPFSHHTELYCPTRIYGINEKFLRHAEQVGLKKKIIDKIDSIEETTREINQLKIDVEFMHKAMLLADECKKLNNKKIADFVKNNLQSIIGAIIFVGSREQHLEYELSVILRESKTELLSTHFKQLIKIMKKVGKVSKDLYCLDERDYLVSIVINRPRTADSWDNSHVYDLLEKLKQNL